MKTKKPEKPRFRILSNAHIDAFHPPTLLPLNKEAIDIHLSTRKEPEYTRVLVTVRHQYVRKKRQ